MTHASLRSLGILERALKEVSKWLDFKTVDEYIDALDRDGAEVFKRAKY